MDQPPPKLVDCPTCGAKNLAISDLCAACGKSLTVVIGPIPKVRHVGLSSVMSCFIVFWIALATVIGFVATCVPVGIATTMGKRSFDPNLTVACSAGAISGFAALWFVGKKLWPGKD